MKIHSSKIQVLAISVLSLTLLSSCELTKAEQTALDEAFGVPAPIPAPSVPPVPSDVPCFAERHTQPEAVVSRKVDLLFVFDTSGSMGNDRRNVADGLDEFVRALPEGTDYQVATMLAHGSQGPHSGRLWKHKKNNHVLSSATMSLDEIVTQLRDNMINAPSDVKGSSEMGMFSFLRSMEKGPINDIRAKGFYRQDAALAVVFISDENDVCATYPAGVTPVLDDTGTEAKERARDCAGITPSAVLERLRAMQGDRPWVVGGVLYNDVSKVPGKSKDNGITQEEYGYGYMELIALAKGVSADISGRRYEQGLESVGKLVTIKLNPNTNFQLGNDDVDTASLKVWVDGKIVDFAYDNEHNSVGIDRHDAGGSKATVDIQYCLKDAPDVEQPPGTDPSPTPTPTPTPSPSPSPTGGPCQTDDCGGIGT